MARRTNEDILASALRTVHLAAARRAPAIEPRRFLALQATLILLLAPCAAVADIYKWNDEQGKLVISNVPPVEMAKVRNYQLVMKETAAGAPVATSAQHAATATELALLQRIETLERQLQAQQYAYQPAASPPPMADGSYYAAPPPPPYYATYYPSYYPSYYYRIVPTYSYVRPVPAYAHRVYPSATVIARPGFGFAHGPAFHGGGGHRGRR